MLTILYVVKMERQQQVLSKSSFLEKFVNIFWVSPWLTNSSLKLVFYLISNDMVSVIIYLIATICSLEVICLSGILNDIYRFLGWILSVWRKLLCLDCQFLLYSLLGFVLNQPCPCAVRRQQLQSLSLRVTVTAHQRQWICVFSVPWQSPSASSPSNSHPKVIAYRKVGPYCNMVFSKIWRCWEEEIRELTYNGQIVCSWLCKAIYLYKILNTHNK